MRFCYIAQATFELMSQPLKSLNARIIVLCRHAWLLKEILQNIFSECIHLLGGRVCVLVLFVALVLSFHHVGPGVELHYSCQQSPQARSPISGIH